MLGGADAASSRRDAYGRMFSVGYAPLQDLEGHRLGMLAVAVDEDALVPAKLSGLALAGARRRLGGAVRAGAGGAARRGG